MLIPIGRFSKMTRLSIKALRLYDERGLLTPAFVDPASGYRYYRLEQARAAELIRILRSVEMPLSEIKELVQSRDADQVNERLLAHRERLAERLVAQQQMLGYLESLIEDRQRLTPYEIDLTEAPPQTVAAVKVRTSLADIGRKIAGGFQTLASGLQDASVTPSGPPLILYQDVIDDESDGDVEICAPVQEAFGFQSGVYGRELEGGTLATVLHHGAYQEISPAYHFLTSWISENGYDIAGPPREVYLNDPRSHKQEELKTRVEFPICPNTMGDAS